MKQLSIALSLAVLAAACRSTSDLNTSNPDVIEPASCCATECCEEAATCCGSEGCDSTECCESKAQVCPVTGATEE